MCVCVCAHARVYLLGVLRTSVCGEGVLSDTEKKTLVVDEQNGFEYVI